jgi:hypothetical protein
MSYAIWQFSAGTSWLTFDTNSNTVVENAYQANNQDTVLYSSVRHDTGKTWTYSVNLAAMTQTNTSTSVSRNIQRVLVSAPAWYYLDNNSWSEFTTNGVATSQVIEASYQAALNAGIITGQVNGNGCQLQLDFSTFTQTNLSNNTQTPIQRIPNVSPLISQPTPSVPASSFTSSSITPTRTPFKPAKRPTPTPPSIEDPIVTAFKQKGGWRQAIELPPHLCTLVWTELSKLPRTNARFAPFSIDTIPTTSFSTPSTFFDSAIVMNEKHYNAWRLAHHYGTKPKFNPMCAASGDYSYDHSQKTDTSYTEILYKQFQDTEIDLLTGKNSKKKNSAKKDAKKKDAKKKASQNTSQRIAASLMNQTTAIPLSFDNFLAQPTPSPREPVAEPTTPSVVLCQDDSSSYSCPDQDADFFNSYEPVPVPKAQVANKKLTDSSTTTATATTTATTVPSMTDTKTTPTTPTANTNNMQGTGGSAPNKTISALKQHGKKTAKTASNPSKISRSISMHDLSGSGDDDNDDDDDTNLQIRVIPNLASSTPQKVSKTTTLDPQDPSLDKLDEDIMCTLCHLALWDKEDDDTFPAGDIIQLPCTHTVHRECLKQGLSQPNAHASCAVCRSPFLASFGKQAQGTATFSYDSSPCSTFNGYGTITATFQMNSGTITKDDGSSVYYSADSRVGYWPMTPFVLKILLPLYVKAWLFGKLFTVGRSHTRSQDDVIIYAIHLKTQKSAGAYGYPDPGWPNGPIDELISSGLYLTSEELNNGC